MATIINLTYCGMAGSGATVKLAKQDAARKIEAVLSGYYTPYMMRAGDLLGVMWREPNGYSYKIIRPDTKAGQVFGNSLCIGSTEADTREAMASHMAQNIGSYAGLEKHLTKYAMRDLDNYFEFQRKYSECKAAGMSDTDAHASASNRP